MHDLQEVYRDLAGDPDFCRATAPHLRDEFRTRSGQAGYPPVVADFFLAMKGQDRAEHVLRAIYAQMRERWLQDGRWLSPEEARATSAWAALLRAARQLPDFK